MVKSQSAMEYLMTYGWAILAIAIVMVSLYSLGIFNTGNLQPTATPGSCEVVRTVAQTSLAGQCSNLIPKYVGAFHSADSSNVVVPNTASINPTTALTYSFWVYLTTSSTVQCLVDKNWGGVGGGQIYIDASNKIQYNVGTTSIGVASPSAMPINKWIFIAGTASSSGVTLYVNSTVSASTATAPTLASSSLVLGMASCASGTADYLGGSMANVQIYNTSLDSSSIQALYQEGIGGAPIDVRHLVGWWPLNGNANDYSGNNNQGTSTNVAWNANWQSGYTAPIT